MIQQQHKDKQEQSYLHVDTTWKHECPNENTSHELHDCEEKMKK